MNNKAMRHLVMTGRKTQRMYFALCACVARAYIGVL